MRFWKILVWVFLMWLALHLGKQWGQESQAKVDKAWTDSGVFENRVK